MPPPTQQGSRAGLITALVIFVILFVTSTILFIYQTAETDKATKLATSTQERYTPIVNDAQLADTKVTELIEAGKPTNPGSASKTAIEVALEQRDQAIKLVLGAGATGGVKEAAGQAAAAINAAKTGQQVIQVTDTAGLAAIIGSLTTAVAGQAQDKTGLMAQLDAAQKAAAAIQDEQKGLLAERDKQIADLKAQYETAMAALTEYRATVDTKVAGIETSTQGAVSTANAAQEKLAQLVTQLQAASKKKDDQIKALQDKSKLYRIDVKEPIVQVADGRIARLPGNGMAYIDLGSGNQVTAGMTFEVYDKYTGIPALGQDGLRPTDMPVGKASIEVMRVSAGSSECRIIRRTPGQELVEGDYIANLVYEPKTKFNFVVYGEFDLDQNGIASTGDAEVIKQLITRWGGKVQPAINADTDFVIMGKEPMIPELTEDQANDPVEIKRKEEATAASNAFNEVVTRANQFSVPVMNQNRFLYFCGYYSQAPR